MRSRSRLGLCLGLALTVLSAPLAIANEGGGTILGRHNGSDMRIFENRIVYDTPKASLRDVVRPGTVLVEGRWTGPKFSGFAYAFKKGCSAARYAVIGRRTDSGSMIFTGPGPVRDGCAVVDYSPDSVHSRLVVDGIWSP